MPKNKAYLVRCQRCSKWLPVEVMLRQAHIILAPRGENRLTYSRPSDSSWTISGGTFSGYITKMDSAAYTYVDGAGNISRLDGAPTWAVTSACSWVSPAVDMTGWVTATVGLSLALNCESSGGMETTISLTDGTHSHTLKTSTDTSLLRWHTSISISDLTSFSLDTVSIRVDVAASGDIGLDECFILKDDASEQLRRGVMINTNGTAVVRTSDSEQLVTLVVCPKCRRHGEIRFSNMVDYEPYDTPDIREDLEVL